MTNKSEQWLLDGKCTMCRRQSYCSTKCKAYKERQDYELRCAVSRALFRGIRK